MKKIVQAARQKYLLKRGSFYKRKCGVRKEVLKVSLICQRPHGLDKISITKDMKEKDDIYVKEASWQLQAWSNMSCVQLKPRHNSNILMYGKQVLLVYYLATSNHLCSTSEEAINLPHHGGHGKAQYLLEIDTLCLTSTQLLPWSVQVEDLSESIKASDNKDAGFEMTKKNLPTKPAPLWNPSQRKLILLRSHVGHFMITYHPLTYNLEFLASLSDAGREPRPKSKEALMSWYSSRSQPKTHCFGHEWKHRRSPLQKVVTITH